MNSIRIKAQAKSLKIHNQLTLKSNRYSISHNIIMETFQKSKRSKQISTFHLIIASILHITIIMVVEILFYLKIIIWIIRLLLFHQVPQIIIVELKVLVIIPYHQMIQLRINLNIKVSSLLMQFI